VFSLVTIAQGLSLGCRLASGATCVYPQEQSSVAELFRAESEGPVEAICRFASISLSDALGRTEINRCEARTRG
jgi:hypothetical protein